MPESNICPLARYSFRSSSQKNGCHILLQLPPFHHHQRHPSRPSPYLHRLTHPFSVQSRQETHSNPLCFHPTFGNMIKCYKIGEENFQHPSSSPMRYKSLSSAIP